MFNKISKLIVIAVFGFIVSGCAISDIYHKYMMNDEWWEWRWIRFFKQEKSGKVKISKIMDEYFVQVTVLEGTVERNNMVQLKSK